MRYICFLLIFLISPFAFAQHAPIMKSMKKKSAHVLKVRVVEGLIDSKTTGPVLVEVMDVYKSSTIKVGDRIAIKMLPILLSSDSTILNNFSPGMELIVFLPKEKPKSYSASGKQFSFYSLYDDYSGWMFFNETIGEFLKNKK